jgi:hypothetical protein
VSGTPTRQPRNASPVVPPTHHHSTLTRPPSPVSTHVPHSPHHLSQISSTTAASPPHSAPMQVDSYRTQSVGVSPINSFRKIYRPVNQGVPPPHTSRTCSPRSASPPHHVRVVVDSSSHNRMSAGVSQVNSYNQINRLANKDAPQPHTSRTCSPRHASPMSNAPHSIDSHTHQLNNVDAPPLPIHQSICSSTSSHVHPHVLRITSPMNPLRVVSLSLRALLSLIHSFK